jgi:DNA polymerase-3 subunit alpha
MMSHSGKTHDAAAVGQMSLFGGSGFGAAMDVRIELLRSERDVEQVDHREVLNWEKELIGVYLSEHPLSRYVDLLQSITSVTTAELDESTNGRIVAVLGLLSYLRTHTTRKGDPMAFGGLEDLQGTVELIFFPRTWKECRADIELDQVYLVRGKVQVENGDQAKIFVDTITSNLTLGQSADVPVDLPLPAVIDDFEPPEDDDFSESDIAEPQPVYQVQFNGHAATPVTPEPEADIRAAASGSQTAEKEAFTLAPGTPPPPPNFESEDDQWFSSSSPVKADLSNGNGRNGDSSQNATGQNGRTAESVPPPVEKNPDKVVVVKVRPVGDWQKTCRELVTVAEQFEGRDSLRLILVGHPLVMEFPNQNTRYCPELVLNMEQLPVTVHVETV